MIVRTDDEVGAVGNGAVCHFAAEAAGIIRIDKQGDAIGGCQQQAGVA